MGGGLEKREQGGGARDKGCNGDKAGGGEAACLCCVTIPMAAVTQIYAS